MRLIYAPEADADLRELEAYWASDGNIAAARRYLDDLVDAIESLVDFPQRHPALPEVGAEHRVFIFRRKITVIYRIDDERLTVVGVLGAGRLVTLNPGSP